MIAPDSPKVVWQKMQPFFSGKEYLVSVVLFVEGSNVVGALVSTGYNPKIIKGIGYADKPFASLAGTFPGKQELRVVYIQNTFDEKPSRGPRIRKSFANMLRTLAGTGVENFPVKDLSKVGPKDVSWYLWTPNAIHSAWTDTTIPIQKPTAKAPESAEPEEVSK